MIQRKQTLFLLGTAIIAIVMLFVPFIGFTRTGEEFNVNLISGINSANMDSNIYYPFVLSLLVIIFAVVTIFLYKNRIIQYKLANAIVLLSVFTTGLFFLLDFVNVSVDNLHFTVGAFLPIINAGLAFFAGHFIKKDELLVRSANRIR